MQELSSGPRQKTQYLIDGRWERTAWSSAASRNRASETASSFDTILLRLAKAQSLLRDIGRLLMSSGVNLGVKSRRTATTQIN